MLVHFGLCNVMQRPPKTKLTGDRRVAIPARLCEEVGFVAGDDLIWQSEVGTLRLIPLSQVYREVQAAFAPYFAEGESVVEAMMQDRIDEFAIEEARDRERWGERRE
jgi:hypothetical protein